MKNMDDISEKINDKTETLLHSVGDMSLKRRAAKIIEGLDIKEGDEILDLGCGDGYYLYLLSNLPIKLSLMGYEFDKSVLKNTQKNLVNKKIRLIQGDIQKMPFKDKSHKKVILTEVLEHIPDDKKALAEIYRILDSDGILVMTVPSYNFPFLWDPINWILQKFGTHISGTGFFAGIWARHLRLYKRKELIKLVEQAGFKIMETRELTTRCLPFNHHVVNLVARFLYDLKPSSKLSDPISKFKNAKKPFIIKLCFGIVNTFDKLNDIFPGKRGLNIYIKARK